MMETNCACHTTASLTLLQCLHPDAMASELTGIGWHGHSSRQRVTGHTEDDTVKHSDVSALPGRIETAQGWAGTLHSWLAVMIPFQAAFTCLQSFQVVGPE